MLKWWGFTKHPLVGIYVRGGHLHRSGGDLLNVHHKVLKWWGFTSKRCGFPPGSIKVVPIYVEEVGISTVKRQSGEIYVKVVGIY